MRSLLGGLFAFLILFLASTASAQITGRVEVIGFNGEYRPGCWTPMLVRLQSVGAPTGFYELRVWQHDLDGDLPYFSQRVSITAGAGELPFWTYFIPEPIHGGLAAGGPDLEQRLRVTVHDAAGKELVQIPVANVTARSVDPMLGPYEKVRGVRFVLFVGSGSMPPLADYNDPKRIVGIKEDLVGTRITADRLPENVIGYEGVDAVVWLEGDPAQLNVSGGRRFDALRDYVRHGGHLVLCTPPQWQQLAGFEDMMPVDVSGTETNIQQSPIRELAGDMPYPTGVSGLPRQNPWATYRGAQTIAMATPREGAVVDLYADRVNEPTKPEDRAPWLVRRPYGFGCVSWVGQDLGNRELVDRANWGWPVVWERVLGSNADPVVEPSTAMKARYGSNGVRDFGFGVVDAMNLSGRGAKLIIVTLLFFIIYWVLVGPGAFFWLRYKNRATLNWFVFGMMALGATAITLGLVRLILRGDPEVKHVSLVRVDCTDLARTATVVSRIGMYVPRDGAQHIEVAEGAAGTLVPTLTPFPIHPSIHARRDGDKYLYSAPRDYRVNVPTADAAGVATSDVPFRTTMKRLRAVWSGPLDARIEGSAKLETSSMNVGFISGTLRNLTGADLRNVYVAFRHQLPEGSPVPYLLYVPLWKNGTDLDLARAFNPPPGKSASDITVGDAEKRVMPNAEFPVRGRFDDWMVMFTSRLRAGALGESSSISDLDQQLPISVPIVSFFEHFPINENQSDGGGLSVTRADLHRTGQHDWDASASVSAGRLVIVAQVDDAPLPLPLGVESSRISGSGRTFYQFLVPLAPLPDAPAATRPASP